MVSLKDKNFWFYVGLLLITISCFPFNNYGLGSAKAISIFPFIIYLLGLLFRKVFSLSRNAFFELFWVVLLLFVSYVICIVRNLTFVGFNAAISMWVTYFVSILSVLNFIKSAEKKEIILMFRCILKSFKIALIFGLVEMFYFYIAKIDLLSKILSLFLRDEVFLGQNRLQFSFGEPSEAGLFVCCLLIPTIFALRRLGYKFTSNDKISIILIFALITFFSRSSTYYVLLGTLVMTYFFISSKKKVYIKVFLISIAVLAYTSISMINLNSIANRNNIRILKLFTNKEDAMKGDGSSAVRTGLWIIAIDMFRNNVVCGVGWGNFGESFDQYYQSLDDIYKNSEMHSKLGDKTQQSYSIVSTSLAEGGLLGLVWLLLLLGRIRYRGDYSKYFAPTFLVAIMQNMFIYVPGLILVYVLLSNKKINNLLCLKE